MCRWAGNSASTLAGVAGGWWILSISLASAVHLSAAPDAGHRSQKCAPLLLARRLEGRRVGGAEYITDHRLVGDADEGELGLQRQVRPGPDRPDQFGIAVQRCCASLPASPVRRQMSYSASRSSATADRIGTDATLGSGGRSRPVLRRAGSAARWRRGGGPGHLRGANSRSVRPLRADSAHLTPPGAWRRRRAVPPRQSASRRSPSARRRPRGRARPPAHGDAWGGASTAPCRPSSPRPGIGRGRRRWR